MLNQQARTIIEIYPSIPIYLLLSKASLIPAKTLLDFRQKFYSYQLLTLPDHHHPKYILSVNLKMEDESSKPREQLKETLM